MLLLWAQDITNIQYVGDLLLQYDLVHRKRGERKRFQGQREILNIVTAFDIETTQIQLPPDGEHVYNTHAFMYVWQWQFADKITLMGRTWQQFIIALEYIKQILDVHPDKPLLTIYVHNLSFEFVYLCGIYPFKPQQVFAVKSRKVLYCRMYDSFQFRCSYLQSNMSLKKFAQAMQTDTGKASGYQFDYGKKRFPWTPLTEKEIDYCRRDVISLVQAITNQMKKDGDTLLTIPYTSTGYVRRDCRAAVAPIRKWWIKPLLPDIQVYKMLRQAFRGGNCHANRYHKGQIVYNAVSWDMVSCYPAQQLTRKFPITPFQKMCNPVTMQRIEKAIASGKNVVARYRFYDLQLRDQEIAVPYLAVAKTRGPVGLKCDNGRILSARVFETTLTEIDLTIVKRQYKYSAIVPIDAIVATAGMLPAEYRRVIQNYYEVKTQLKTKQKTDDDARYMYNKAKNKLNSLYGMSAQDPVHALVQYIRDLEQEPFRQSDYTDKDVKKRLQAALFPYQFGVYTTAWARWSLQAGMEQVARTSPEGYMSILYCDTDSIKCVGSFDLSALNSKREQAAINTGAYAVDQQGNTHYMGVFEIDGVYDQFKTLGAKRYADVSNGKLQVTVSGVVKTKNPETGITYAAQELKNLQNFKQGFVFDKAGGTTSVYNDHDNFDFVDQETGNAVHITSNVCIVDTQYQISNDKDYIKLCQECISYREWKKERQ